MVRQQYTSNAMWGLRESSRCALPSNYEMGRSEQRRMKSETRMPTELDQIKQSVLGPSNKGVVC